MPIIRAIVAAVAILAAGLSPVIAETYPSKTIRIIVPFAAGGGTDLIARSVSQKLQDALGASVVVDNRGGAGGNVGTDVVAKAKPDGYTLLLGYSSNFSISPFIYPSLPYDPLKDFEPITLVAIATNLMVAHPSANVKTLKELQAAAKERDKKLLFASAGVGTVGHLVVEVYKHKAGVDLVHVPYKGASAALADLLTGRVELYAGSPAVLMEHVRAGRLVPLGITSEQRQASLDNFPTFKEQGFDVIALAWFGLLAPAGTPKDIVDKINKALITSIKSPDVVESFGRIGYDVQTNTPDAFAALIKSDYETWKKVIAITGTRAE